MKIKWVTHGAFTLSSLTYTREDKTAKLVNKQTPSRKISETIELTVVKSPSNP